MLNEVRTGTEQPGGGAGFDGWLKDPPRGEYVFARAAGQKPVSSQAARATLRGMLKKAGIDKKISPHKLRHTYATNLLNAGAERVDIKALLGHESIATTQIYSHVGQERMEKVVGSIISIYSARIAVRLVEADWPCSSTTRTTKWPGFPGQWTVAPSPT